MTGMEVRVFIQPKVIIFNTVTMIIEFAAVLPVIYLGLVDHRLGILKETTNKVSIVCLVSFPESSTLFDGPGIVRWLKDMQISLLAAANTMSMLRKTLLGVL